MRFFARIVRVCDRIADRTEALNRRVYDVTEAGEHVFAWVSFLLIVATAVLAFSPGCSGAQRTWQTNTDAALSGAAHAVDAVDAIAAARYLAEARLPGANLEQLDAKYAVLRLARAEARASLIAAEQAVTAGGGCAALVAVRLAKEHVTRVGEALAVATNGQAQAPALLASVRALLSVIASGPVCP